MFSRVPILIFFVLANIILLSNITIPHHHHNSKVCIVDSHCQTNSETHKHESDGHHHDHDGNNNSEYCVFDQIYLIPYNQLTQDRKDLVSIYLQSQPEGFQTVSFDQELSVKFPISRFVTQRHLLSFCYTSAASTNIGLRAPLVA